MNSNVNVTDRETLWRQRVGLFFQNVFASEVSWKNKDVWGGQETHLMLFFSLSLISSCSERERLHPQSQSQGTDSGHSIHHYAPAGRGQCATGNMVLLQSSRAKFCTRYGHLPSHGSWRIPIFLAIASTRARDKEDLSYILDGQRLNSAKAVAVGWI